MQFHHHGYVSSNPRLQPAAGTGLERPVELPEVMDVLIVGAGPAGHIAAAQLAQFPSVNTRIIERNAGRLELGHADGVQVRTVETFQAFGFAKRLIEEAYHITTFVFWGPDPAHPENVIRKRITVDDPTKLSEFPHLVLNQARVQDYFAECMADAPTRMEVDFGWEFLGLEVHEGSEYPVEVRLRGTAHAQQGRAHSVRAKYVVGCDGARSQVRAAIGRRMSGTEALHAWGVMDVLAASDFPDIRTKCVIQSHDGGNILLIPREGGFLFRMYVDAGDVPEHAHHEVRSMTVEEIVTRANRILHPYSIEVRSVAWHSVYEVAQRLTDRFDDVDAAEVGKRTPRVFITGDACHTHSAKAGQGMNVSMQDGFNIAWKLGYVLDGRSPEALLGTYSAERQPVAQELIDFDKQWSGLMATRNEKLENDSAVSDFFVRTFEFTTGLMTRYQPSLVTGVPTWQQLATGYPLGARFHSAPVVRVCDADAIELGHHARADGRWRLYAFADAPRAGEPSSLERFADWLDHAPDSPLAAMPEGLDRDAWFDAKVIYQQRFDEVDLGRVPAIFKPRVAEFQLVDYEKVFAAGAAADGTVHDIFELRGIDRGGVVVVVRPDMYVAHVLPLTATAELAAFFRPVLQSGT